MPAQEPSVQIAYLEKERLIFALTATLQGLSIVIYCGPYCDSSRGDRTRPQHLGPPCIADIGNVYRSAGNSATRHQSIASDAKLVLSLAILDRDVLYWLDSGMAASSKVQDI